MWFKKRKPIKYVRVSYRDVENAHKPLLITRGYAFMWDLDKSPEIGDWVYIPGNDGVQTGVVVGVDDGDREAVSKVIGLIPDDLLDATMN